jgi:hypothetical protein
MTQARTSSNNLPKFAQRFPANSGPSSKERGLSTRTKSYEPAPEDKLRQISIPVGVDYENLNPLHRDYNELVQKIPHIDTVQRLLGKAGDGLSTAGSATKEILGSLGSISNVAIRKSTSNPTATTVIAGGGSAIAGLLSFRSLINTFKHFTDPKTGSWVLSGLQAIIQGGVAVGLGAPFFGKGEKSPFIKRIDGEDVVEVKAILGGVGASLLLSALTALSQDRLPIISKLPFINKLAGGIAKDLSNGIKTLTSGEQITQEGIGGGANQAPLGLAA